MEKLLEDMANLGFSITIARNAAGDENTYRTQCRISSAGGVTKLGVGDTLPLAILRALVHMVSTLEGYLVVTEQERDQARHLLHRNGLVVNMLDDEEVAAMRKLCPFAPSNSAKE